MKYFVMYQYCFLLKQQCNILTSAIISGLGGLGVLGVLVVGLVSEIGSNITIGVDVGILLPGIHLVNVSQLEDL